MDYKNDNRTPRDRVTGEFLSELLFTELGGECDCDKRSMSVGKVRTSVPEKRSDCRNNTNTSSDCFRAAESRRCRSERNNVEITGSYSLAMAYVPMQRFGELFDIEEGFCQGTIFRELRFPFYPTPCRKEGD